MIVIPYEAGVMYLNDAETLLSQYKATGLRVDSGGNLELLILAEDEPVLVWQDIQEIAQIKTQ